MAAPSRGSKEPPPAAPFSAASCAAASLRDVVSAAAPASAACGSRCNEIQPPPSPILTTQTHPQPQPRNNERCATAQLRRPRRLCRPPSLRAPSILRLRLPLQALPSPSPHPTAANTTRPLERPLDMIVDVDLLAEGLEASGAVAIRLAEGELVLDGALRRRSRRGRGCSRGRPCPGVAKERCPCFLAGALRTRAALSFEPDRLGLRAGSRFNPIDAGSRASPLESPASGARWLVQALGGGGGGRVPG